MRKEWNQRFFFTAGRRQGVFRTAVLCIVLGGCLWLSQAVKAAAGNTEVGSEEYFTIRVTDEQTGRGVPLVELRTVNEQKFVTDSAGVIAFNEPGLMNREVFFFISSHGYEYPADGFGYHGTRLVTKPGETAEIELKRINIAERLYRVTGQGIYRDSVLVGREVPLEKPCLNGKVMGQDSVLNTIYKGKLYWFWGDTSKPSYPLGQFAMSGAVSDLPSNGGLDPDKGVNLEYFTDETGFSKKMCPLDKPGVVWIESPLTLTDPEGNLRILAKYDRLEKLGEVLEQGFIVYNEEKQIFEPVVSSSPNLLIYPRLGHPFKVKSEGQEYYYFASPFPLSVRIRVEADWKDFLDPDSYEVYTAVGSDEQEGYRWVETEKLLREQGGERAELTESLQEEEKRDSRLYDIETGDSILPHGGTVYWNNFREKWIMITTQEYGEPSYLGEVWYAEADTPTGPWVYARKIVTHNNYTFYNPKQHPYFDGENGRTVYFEGTYTKSFTSEQTAATPRYDYNQIMYRLDLSDRRLYLPEAIYRVRGTGGTNEYLPASRIRTRGLWSDVRDVPFFAMAADRVAGEAVPVYAKETESGMRLVTEIANGDDKSPLFYGLPTELEQPGTKVLYEYKPEDTEGYSYSVKSDIPDRYPAKAVCRVWENPSGLLMADGKALPLL